MEKLSVIIPIYNVEKYLDRCIKSICNQTYENLEIILVDDGSTDGSPEMCDQYVEKDKRIKVIHKQNGGLSDARNVGLEYATGQYIFFCDSDDYVERDLISECMESISKDSIDILIFAISKISIRSAISELLNPEAVVANKKS